MTGITVPTARYQEFVAQGPMPQALIEEWISIWKYYDTNTKQQRTYLVDFEEHNPHNYEQVNIYIGVK